MLMASYLMYYLLENINNLYYITVTFLQIISTECMQLDVLVHVNSPLQQCPALAV